MKTLDLTRPEHMCQVCNRNTAGTERVRLKRGDRFVASMHAECAFGVEWTETAVADGQDSMELANLKNANNVLLPINVEHAKAMTLVATHYLKSHDHKKTD